MFSNKEKTASVSLNGAADSSTSVISEKEPDKYIPNAHDIRIIAGDETLVITDDKRIGGLWTGVTNYDPCSGSEQECFEAMRSLISENYEEACESLTFKLDGNLYLLNIADCQNRGLMMKMDCSICIFARIRLAFSTLSSKISLRNILVENTLV